MEAKLRCLEQAGVEASSEIQTAARRVLEENRKLRALLQRRGISEPELVAALGGPSDRTYEQTSAATSLNAMLDKRTTSNTPSSRSSPNSSLVKTESTPRQPPSAPNGVPAQRPTVLSCCDSPSPSSIVSSTGTPPPASSYPTSFYPTAMASPVPEIKTEDVPYANPYDHSYNNNSWPYTTEYNLMPQSTTYYSNPTYVDATSGIRTMRSSTRPDLDAGVACPMPTQDYYTNSNFAFSMPDKFAPPHSGI